MSHRFTKLAAHYDTTDLSEQITAAESAPLPAPAGSEVEAFTVRLPVTLLDALRQRATAEGISTGQMIRRILEEAVSEPVDNSACHPGE